MNRIYVLIMLGLTLLSASCARKNAPLMIFTEEYPPISFAVGDSISGYGTDVVRAIQAKLGSRDKITLTKWSEAYDKALNEANVVLFSMEQTPARMELFNWIGPLGENTSSFYVRSDSKLELKTPDEAKDMKAIATTSSWFSEQFLLEKGFSNLKSSSSPVDNVKQVMEGKADATILTDLTAPEIIRTAGYAPSDMKPVLEMMTTKYYIVISKQTDPKVLERWEKAFMELSGDGSLAKIKEKWGIK